MYLSKMLIPTQKQDPNDAEINSHKLLVRAGMMRKLASGIYAFLPLGLKAFKNVETIVREEMNKAGAQELLMSALLPADYYMESGRWETFGDSMFKLLDRNNRQYCLGPTHEEIFTIIVRNEIKSYKALPITLYQIQTKYRDEGRPRFGLLRGREFSMKDAYSFNTSEEDLDVSYKAMYDAYCKIFTRCSLEYTVVDADSGAMGGSGSQEFMIPSDVGEDDIVSCSSCDYCANSEKAQSKLIETDKQEPKETEEVDTVDIGTIDELCEFFNIEATNFCKTLVYQADDKLVAVLLRGDRELNEVKLQNKLNCLELAPADPGVIYNTCGVAIGFLGPIGLKVDKILVDEEVMQMSNFITGANKNDKHIKNVNIKDFKYDEICDLRTAKEGDICPICGGSLKVTKGIEVGHIFKLGTKYSKALNCVYLDANGKEQPMVMGCYGIGVSRTLATIIEQHSDENGIKWPLNIAPYKACVVPIKQKDETQKELADKIYNELINTNADILYDDRNARFGVKMNDLELIGIPYIIIVGREAVNGMVELKNRTTGEKIDVEYSEAIEIVKSALKRM